MKNATLFKCIYVIADLFWCFFLFTDDGKLSFDEFKSYFSDGVLTTEELKELFHTIDTHNTESVTSFLYLFLTSLKYVPWEIVALKNYFNSLFSSNVDTDELCGE